MSDEREPGPKRKTARAECTINVDERASISSLCRELTMEVNEATNLKLKKQIKHINI